MFLFDYTGANTKLQHLKHIHHYNAEADDKKNTDAENNNFLYEFLVDSVARAVHIRRKYIIVVTVVTIILRLDFFFMLRRFLFGCLLFSIFLSFAFICLLLGNL